MSTRVALLVLSMVLLAGAAPGAAGSRAPGTAVSAVYHEGTVTFRVDRPDVVAVRARVFDAASDALLFDSHALRGAVVEWSAGEHDGAWRFVVEGWNAAGELVTSQSATSEGVEQIYALDFDVIGGGTTLRGGGASPIVIDGPVNFGAPPYASLERDAFGSVLTLDSGAPGLFLQEEVPPADGINPPQTFAVDLLEEGDTSVELPVDAVSAPEILDEPGVVFNATSGISPLAGLETVLTATVIVPADGWLMATAALDFQLNHVSGTTSSVQTGLNLDSDASIPSTQQLDVLFPSPATTGTYYSSASPVAVFPATAGAHTVYLLAEELSGSVSYHEANLAVVYLPTTYGILKHGGEGASGPSADGSDPDAVAARRAAAQAADAERRRAERETTAQRTAAAAARRGTGRD